MLVGPRYRETKNEIAFFMKCIILRKRSGNNEECGFITLGNTFVRHAIHKKCAISWFFILLVLINEKYS